MSQLRIHPPSKRKVVRTYTFGCKVNQCDTAVMEGHLRGSGDFCVGNGTESPDVVVVNTCTVTAQADRQARQLIRRIHHEYSSAKIVVTGCYAESQPEVFQGLEGVTEVLPIRQQHRLPQVLGSTSFVEETVPIVDSSRTRATLKMQDGCNAYCSFCILPYIRGRSRSVPLREISRAARELEAAGYREIVVTGTNIGAYGRDLSPKTRFSDALIEVAQAAPNCAIRVSSLEPAALTADVIAVVASTPQIRPHFHIPLQSGSDAVLRRMNRKHTVATYEERLEALLRARPNVAIGIDAIAGFPGETDAEFQETCRLVAELPIVYVHAFPFSSRPGTKAAELVDDVPGPVKKERTRELRRIGFGKRKRFYSGFLGSVQPVLVENKRDAKGSWTGHTPHYVAVRVACADSLVAQEVAVKLDSVIGETPETLHMAGEVV